MNYYKRSRAVTMKLDIDRYADAKPLCKLSLTDRESDLEIAMYMGPEELEQLYRIAHRKLAELLVARGEEPQGRDAIVHVKRVFDLRPGAPEVQD